MRGQLGAIHAIAAHFAVKTEPALIAMPTGSGKTAVLALSPYILEATRVLIATPSRLVAGQIADQFRSLALLRDIGALTGDVKPPSVHERLHRVLTVADWTSLAKFDVVIGTPNTVSPAIREIAQPPEDLFDLLLIDEAHHSPAKTWREMINAFPKATRILFTATPFRLDRRELGARFTFVYTVAQAFHDGVYGDIHFLPVDPGKEAHDKAIATAAEAKLNQDREAGYEHFVMVRTDTTARAEELAAIYSETTSLRLETIHSRYSQRTVRNAVKRLRAGDLDGVISVDMLGEGFDFPNLKVAAVHSPHRSLGSTIQFIGRFARTNAKVGPATFLAIPSDVDTEVKRLYQEEAVWEEMLPNLIDAKVAHELKLQEDLGTYDLKTASEDEERDISLWSLTPYFHVKIYQCDGEADLASDIAIAAPLEIIYRQVSEALASVVFITREVSLPRWTSVSQFPTVIHDLFICYYDSDSRLLFICASRRDESLYNSIATDLIDGTHRRLPLSRINRALRNLTDQEFFSIGMRNRAVTSSVESYRTLTGLGVHRALKRSDGRLFHQGHSFGRAKDQNNQMTTIGLASSSKIWSNRSAQLPDLIDWCRELAANLSSSAPITTGSEFDYLPTDVEAVAIPPNVIAGAWNRIGHGEPPMVNIALPQSPETVSLWDVDIIVDYVQSIGDVIVFEMRAEGWSVRVRFNLLPAPTYTWVVEPPGPVTMLAGRLTVTFLEYLDSFPPTFFFADGSSLEGNLLLTRPSDDLPVFDLTKIEVVDWPANGVDIEREFWDDNAAHDQLSIHDYIRERLSQDADAQVVAFDHDPGEMADFVAIKSSEGVVTITMFHCKKSGGPLPGHRVEDVYEVCGQAVKSLTWMRPEVMLEKLRRRVQPHAHRMVRGTWAQLEDLLALAKRSRLATNVVVVQPGIAVSQVNQQIASVLASTHDFVTTNGDSDFRVIGSN
jgi:superfamily II DNA or RNA helicase